MYICVFCVYMVYNLENCFLLEVVFSFKVEIDSNYVIDRFCYLVWVIFLDFWMLLDNYFCLYIIVYWNKMVDGVDDLGLK